MQAGGTDADAEKHKRNLGLASGVLSGGVAIVLTQLCIVVLSFLSQRVVLSTLTKEMNGFLFVERSLADLLLIIIVDFGLNGIVMRRIVQEPERTNEILSTLFAFRVIIFLPATLVCLVSAYVSDYNLLDIAMYCAFLGINSRTTLFRYVMEMPYRAHQRLALVSVATILDGALLAALLFFWRFELTPSKIFFASLVTSVPGFLLFIFAKESRRIRLKFVTRTEMRALITAALPVVFVLILLKVHDRIDAFILSWFTTPTEVGVFGAAYQTIGPLTATIAVSLGLAMTPAIARLAVEDFQACSRYALISMRFLLVTAVCTSTVLSILTPFIIDVVTNGRYASDHAQFFMFMWMPVPIFLLGLINDLNVAMGNQKRNLPIAWILCGCTVVLGLAIIPQYGAQGAIVSKLLTLAIAASVATYMFSRILGQPLHLSLVLRALALIATGVAASNLLPTVVSMPVAAITSLVLVLVMTGLLGVVDKSDVMRIKRLVFASKT